MSSSSAMSPRAWWLLIVLSVLWGGSFFFVEVALTALSPLVLVTCRVGIAALALVVFFALSGRSLLANLRHWRSFLGMGLLNNAIPFTLLVWGQVHIASGLASILNAFTPVFTVLVAHFLTRDERLSANKIAGIALGVAGVALMIGTDAFAGPQFAISGTLAGMLACLGATLSYAFAAVFGKRFSRLGVRPLGVALGQLSASTVIMIFVLGLAIASAGVPWPSTPPVSVMLSVAALALLSTALAYVLFFRILEMGGATNISLVTLLVPVSAILLGWLVLGERLDTVDFAGLVLIGAGLLALDGRLLRRWGGSR